LSQTIGRRIPLLEGSCKEIENKEILESIKNIKEIFEKYNIKASEETINTINTVLICFQKYKDHQKIVNKIINEFKVIIRHTKSEKVVLNSAKCILKYEKYPSVVSSLLYWLATIAVCRNSEKEILDVIKWFSSDAVFDLISKCYEKNQKTANKIIDEIGDTFYFMGADSEKIVLKKLNQLQKKLS
ncbi:MAG: hypothetical protein QXI58_02045, partial [Candidatus Micrarchaeia archaeon]